MDETRTKKFICIICPKCCELETDGTEVKGAKCKKGKEFALQEFIEPLRVITTTVRCDTDGRRKMIPVKSAAPVPLEDIPRIMRCIKAVTMSEVPVLGSRLQVGECGKPVELIVTGE